MVLKTVAMLAKRGARVMIGVAVALAPVVVGAILVMQTCRAQAGPSAWTAPSLQRVAQNAPAGTGSSAQIEAALGETESFQIVVSAPPGNGLSNVSVSVTDLTGPGTISKSNISLFREQYVSVNPGSVNWQGSNQPLGAGVYPDPLIPFNDPSTGLPITGATIEAVPFAVSPSMNQPIWVDVFVPRNAVPGQYTGSYTVTSSQGSFTGQISLTVWHFALPLKPSLQSSFAYSTATGLSAEAELLKHRVTPLAVAAADEPNLISNYGLATTNLGFWSGADVGNCTMSAAPSVSQLQARAAQNQPGLTLFNFTADEIGSCTNLYTSIQQWALNLHQAGINNLVTMAPVTQLLTDGSGTGRSAVDIWVMLPIMYNSAPAMVTTVLQKGDTAWSANTLVQDAYSPKWEIDFDPVNFRIQPGFINQSLGLSGVLYWRVDDWSIYGSNPWTNVNNVGTFSSNNYPGEGVLVYPGTQVGLSGPVASMRLKWLRDGADDFDYITLLKQQGWGDWALQLSRSIAPDWTNWTRDHNLIESVRSQLGAKLDALVAPPPPPAPSAPSSPSPATGSTISTLTPALSWGASSNATSYDVYFGSTSSPALVQNTTGLSYSPGTLAGSTTYFWKVVSKNSGGTASSATWSFTTPVVLAGPPSSPSPASGATSVATSAALSWSAVSGATSYDVYFGTASTPSLVGNVTAASYSPGTLTAGATYYWKVIAKNAIGTAPSTVWSFSTAAPPPPPAPAPTAPVSTPPTTVSVSPQSGSGLTAKLALVFSDASGYQAITGLNLLINSTVQGASGCWLYVQPSSKTLYLANDAGTSWNSAALGSSTVLQNSQCSVAANGVGVQGAGTQLTLSVALQFTSAFAGQKQVYTRAVDTAGLTNGYQAEASWTVSAVSPTARPTSAGADHR